MEVPHCDNSIRTASLMTLKTKIAGKQRVSLEASIFQQGPFCLNGRGARLTLIGRGPGEKPVEVSRNDTTGYGVATVGATESNCFFLSPLQASSLKTLLISQ